MNIAMVKPIPASHPAPATAAQPTPVGSRARPDRTARKLARTTPRGFPTKSPTATARATGSPKPVGSIRTPAFANAKSGMIAKAVQGWSACSRRVRGETASRATAWSRAASCGVGARAPSSSPCRKSWTSRMAAVSVSLPIQRLEGVSSPRTTPARVAWTPDSWKPTHTTAPTTT